jgi:hypothetical protein
LWVHLRRIEPDWRPALNERRALAVALLADGVVDTKIIEQTGLSRTTLWRLRRNGQDKPKCARKPAFQRDVSVSNGATLAKGSFPAILSADASSGNGDLDAIRALLGVAA